MNSRPQSALEASPLTEHHISEASMDAQVLRSRFLAFFAERGHTVVDSSAVVPKSDPTLLFANAGMNQFKDVFLGNEERDYKRAASSQKCIRAGGKHNDLDEVGKDGRHLTFFEMLGNWSFGDYYKEDSIVWGWEFLTEVMELAAERLYVTVQTNDDESWDIWRNKVGVPESRMMRLGDLATGDEENFWSMGPVGPCGPCTEIHYDTRPELPSSFAPNYDGERYVELWNHVFMEFDRDESGALEPLPMKSVDTGMGLERAAAVVVGVATVYETALFTGILEKTAQMLGLNLSQKEILDREDINAFRVIADHVRTLTFAVSEGQPFSNEGRGYVLRRILRRAVRFGRGLGFDGPFLHEISQAVVRDFGEAYPEIVAVASQTQEVLRIEEERFFNTIDRGIARFEDVAAKADGAISGRDAFALYDTFGFPLDLTQIMAEERGLAVDLVGFNEALEEQRARSSEANRFYAQAETGPWLVVKKATSDTFLGYTRDETASRVVRYRARGDLYEILLDMTPFYPEGGGQVGDMGKIEAEDKSLVFTVLDTQRVAAGILHLARLDDGFVTEVSMSKDVIATVDRERRRLTACNHTATHLLQAALRDIVSTEIHQAGSLVRPDKLRFDFTYPKPLTAEQVDAVEARVNAAIRAGNPVVKHADVSRESAEEWGATAIFGEKYGDRVRVVEVPGISMELCGGIHVDTTRDILYFRITQETSIAAGTRRIEGITNVAALQAAGEDRVLLSSIGKAAKVDRPDLILPKLERLHSERAELEAHLQGLLGRIAANEVDRILTRGRKVGDTMVYASKVEIRDRKELLTYADLLRDRMGEAVGLLGAIIDEKPALICVVAKSLCPNLKAGDLVNACAAVVGGKGGGKPALAQAGGNDATRLDEAIDTIYGEVEVR